MREGVEKRGVRQGERGRGREGGREEGGRVRGIKLAEHLKSRLGNREEHGTTLNAVTANSLY